MTDPTTHLIFVMTVFVIGLITLYAVSITPHLEHAPRTRRLWQTITTTLIVSLVLTSLMTQSRLRSQPETKAISQAGQ